MMKKLLAACLALFVFQGLFGQDPVKWSFEAKKIGSNVYELHLIASVNEPWHIYSQTTPDGGPLPTKIVFNKNPMVTIEGTVKESGKIVTKHEEVFDVDVIYFNGKASFVQVIKVKPKIKTSVNGSVEFMACNDTQCMPPSTINFSIPIQ